MFFWGSYNFLEPQQTENPSRPALRYPVYLPPSPSMLFDAGITGPDTPAETAEDAIRKKLHCIDNHRLVVKMMACGQKHLVALMGLASKSSLGGSVSCGAVAATSADGSHAVCALYGMGSNHSGQLGHRLPCCSTSLAKLHFEELLPSGVSAVSIACGDKFTLVAASDGSVFASGDNSFEQLGTAGKWLGFARVRGLPNIKRVFAAANASFALDGNGQLFSWGEAQHGHLCHGDNGERVDPRTLRVVKTHISVPTRVEWFVRRHVVIVDVAVSRSHVVCRSSSDEVYTCGDGTYGKLCTGSFGSSCLPQRIKLPVRAHPERLCAIAAGEDHTLILRESSAVGAVVYHFGRANNGDGQLVPVIVPMPSNVCRIFAGRGTFSAATTSDGLLFTWGRHAYGKVTVGGATGVSREHPRIVASLKPYNITNVAVGGTFVAVAASEGSAHRESTDKDGRWDVLVPHDDRSESGYGDAFNTDYEDAVLAFLTQYLGPSIAETYIPNIPAAPQPTDPHAGKFKPVGAHSLSVGQKVRLWMTNVYALGSISKVLGCNQTDISARFNGSEEHRKEESKDIIIINETDDETEAPGYRFLIHWQREDWKDEEITLYSDDETLQETNPNRWQPFWFLYDKVSANYIADKYV